jgi:aryl-alcohol dehydrogenase-like predicted oxidoreductase
MRLSTEPDRDERRATETIAAALDEGAMWLDTARCYGLGEDDLGHNERLLASALAEMPGSAASIRIVTKCGMTREGGGWQPDGRAAAIVADARASALALGRPADVLLLHAPDPQVPLATSVRALLRAKAEGHARAIGVSNVTRGQLEALEADTSLGEGGAPLALAAVEVALGAYDDAAARGGVVAWCRERGIPVLAHAPFGGPTRAGRIARDGVLLAVARRRGVTPAQVVLAYLLAIDASIVPLPGARRPETARSAIRAAAATLDDADLTALDARFPGLAMVRRPLRAQSASPGSAEVVVIMGLAGAGKTRLARSYVDRGYERLNRDAIGGTLRGLARRLDELLARGVTRVVLDNTYVTRASRSEVLRVAHAAGATVRCVYLDAPCFEAQVNATWRMLEKHGELLGGAELVRRAKSDANLFAPNALFRMERQLERPALDEGFASIDVVPFTRELPDGGAGVAVPLELIAGEKERGDTDEADMRSLLSNVAKDGPLLVFGWRPNVDAAWRESTLEMAKGALAGVWNGPIALGICDHAAGPPVCWCRPPLPGLWLDFARRYALDPRRSVLLARSPAHRTMARSLGLLLVDLAERS